MLSKLGLLVLGCLALGSLRTAAAEEDRGSRGEFGVEERVRSENWDDLFDFNNRTADTQRQWRFRTRVWAGFSPGENLSVFAQVNNETRRVGPPETEFRWDEVIFENLYLDFRFAGGFWLRAGRQNILRGEGFVLCDGGPLDGSRTGYFNALLLSRVRGPSRLEFLAISNPHRDLYLPRFNDRLRPLIEWDEQGLGFYYTWQGPENRSREAYYLFKTATRDPRGPHSPAYQPDRRLHTAGGRIVEPLAPGWSIAAEGALQWGRQQDTGAIRARAGYAVLRRAWDRPWKPVLGLGYTHLSGDDPHTSTIEGWDPLFARWPKWSELYIYTLARERGAAYWTNLEQWQAEIKAFPAAWAEARLSWYRLSAPHPFSGAPALFGGGRHRGQMVQARLDLTFGKHWKAHAVYESFHPGDFYKGVDQAYFLRLEASYRFEKKF